MMKVVSIATFAAERMTDHKSLVPGCAKSYTGIRARVKFSNAKKSHRDRFSATGDLNSLAESTFFIFSQVVRASNLYFYVPL